MVRSARIVNTASNEACRIITTYLKPTPIQLLYPLAGIAPPVVRRTMVSSAERGKIKSDLRHPMYGYTLLNRD